MKSTAILLAVGLASGALAQGCDADDDKKKLQDAGDGGAGGDAAGGASDASGGLAPEGGAPIAPSEAGGESGGSSAGATSEPSGGAAGAGGTAGEAGAGGVAVSCEVAATCTNDLSALGTADFSIAFTIATTATAGSGVVSQRAICMRSKFWDVRMRANGNLSVELDDETNYLNLVVPSSVNDGAPHEVRVCRKSGHVYAFADGELLEDAPNETAFDTLPTFATATTTCTALDGTVMLDGSLTNVCVGAL